MESQGIFSKENQRIALLIAILSSFLTPFLGSSLNVALPSIGKEFGLSAISLSWVATAYLLSTGMLLIPMGKLADIYGRKRIFRIGIITVAVTCSLSVFAPNGVTLIMLRFLQGVESAMIFSTGTAILISVYPPELRGKILGINVASVYTGLSIGPVFGGFLTHQFGWRSIYGVNILIACIVSVLIFKLKGEWRESRHHSYDWKGNLLFSISLCLLVVGFSYIPHWGGFLATGIGIIGLLGFIKWESVTEHPLLYLKLFKDKTFAYSNLAALINYSATFAIGFLISLYLQYIKGLNPQQAGLVLLSQPILMAIFSPIAGRLSDKTEPGIVASIGMAFCTIGLFIFCFLQQNSPDLLIIIGLLFLGLGFGLFSSPNANAIMSSVDKRYYGLASGIMGTMRLCGQLLSMGTATLVFSVYLGKHTITAEYFPLFIQSIKIIFLIFAVLCTFGIFASLSRGRLRVE